MALPFSKLKTPQFSVLHHALQPVGLRGGDLTGITIICGISRNIIVSLLRLYRVLFFIHFLYYAAADIVKYLFKEYGAGRQPSPGLLERLANQSISLVTNGHDRKHLFGFLIFFSWFIWAGYLVSYLCFVISSTLVTGWVPTLVRAGRGMMLFPRATTQPPDTLLVLYSYENNQVENNHHFVSWVHEKQYLPSAGKYDNHNNINKSEPKKWTQIQVLLLLRCILSWANRVCHHLAFAVYAILFSISS